MLKIGINSKKYGTIFFIIDADKYEFLKDYKFRVSNSCGNFYIKCRYKGKNPSINLHNLITGYKMVDHKNRDTLDNRLENLRECNCFQNTRNTKTRKDIKYSKYKGVTKSPNRKRWISRIQFNKKRITIGTYNTEKEAAVAYDKKALELFGEFAYLNFNGDSE